MTSNINNNGVLQKELIKTRDSLVRNISIKYLIATAALVAGITLAFFLHIPGLMAFGIGVIITSVCVLYHYHKEISTTRKFFQNSINAIPISNKKASPSF